MKGMASRKAKSGKSSTVLNISAHLHKWPSADLSPIRFDSPTFAQYEFLLKSNKARKPVQHLDPLCDSNKGTIQRRTKYEKQNGKKWNGKIALILS